MNIHNVTPMSIKQAPFNSPTEKPLFTVTAVKNTPVVFDAKGRALEFKKDWFTFVVPQYQAERLAVEKKVQVVAAREDERKWTNPSTGEVYVTTRIMNIDRFEALDDLREKPIEIKWLAPAGNDDLAIEFPAGSEAPQAFIDALHADTFEDIPF